MKKIMMTLVAAIMAVGVNAQVFVGGGIGFANTDNGDNDVTTFKFLPEVGYTFNDEWSGGVVFGWDGANKGMKKEWTISPYARYTFLKSNVISAFLDGCVGYSHAYNAGIDADGFSLGVKPGLAVKMGQHVSFVTHIGFFGYNHLKDNNTDEKLNNWGVDLDGNNITFGLYYSF